MSSLGIQALLLPLLGIHAAVAHHELMGLFEIARGLGASYRFASAGSGAGAVYSRFILSFCRIVVGGVAHHASVNRSIERTVPQT